MALGAEKPRSASHIEQQVQDNIQSYNLVLIISKSTCDNFNCNYIRYFSVYTCIMHNLIK